MGSHANIRCYAEKDVLRGQSGPDTFVLGDEANVFYNNPGTSPADGNADRAVIVDFELGTDIIEFNGSASDYFLRTTPAGNTNIFHQPTGEVRDLIVVVRGIQLNADDLSDSAIANFV
ncbi:MAG: hypothetical protein ACFBSC_04640 [Microcoleaceae cyanobacterium]